MSQTVSPPDFPKPRGYSNGLVATGRSLFVSGQIAWDKDAHIVSPDFATQFLQAMDNVISVVRAAVARPICISSSSESNIQSPGNRVRRARVPRRPRRAIREMPSLKRDRCEGRGKTSRTPWGSADLRPVLSA